MTSYLYDDGIFAGLLINLHIPFKACYREPATQPALCLKCVTFKPGDESVSLSCDLRRCHS